MGAYVKITLNNRNKCGACAKLTLNNKQIETITKYVNDSGLSQYLKN